MPRQGLELGALRRLNLSVEENTRQTLEVVEEAARYGALVEGEIEGFKRVEEMTDDNGVDEQTLETAVDFVRSTGVDIFAPAIGNAHGMYTTTRRSTASGSATSSRRPESPWRCTVVRA